MKKYLFFSLPFLLFIFLFHFPAPPWPDAIVYDSVARDFLNTGIFRYAIWGAYDSTYLHANFNNGPLYPFIHILFLKVFGSTDSRLLLTFNYLLAVLTFANISRILKLSGEHLLLMVILVFNPVVYHYTNIVRPEWLGIFLLSCMWRVFASYESKPPLRAYIFVSLLLALSALNHQFSIFFVPCVFYAALKREETLCAGIGKCLLISFCTMLFLAPYLIYAQRHWGDFLFQLFGNQITESASGSIFTFVKSFVVPLFYPSIGVFTQTGIIPRWHADMLSLGLIACAFGLILKWRKKFQLSSSTKEAFFFWLFLNMGCAAVTYSPYVTVSFSVLAIAILKDAFPVVPRRLRTILISVAIIGIGSQVVFYSEVTRKLFQWKDYQKAVECLANELPRGADVYVMAYPDPSVELSNRRNDLGVKRYIDFAKYGSAWEVIVAKNDHFIVSDDAYNLNRFDYGNALRNGIGRGEFREVKCKQGNVGYTLFERRK